MSLSLHATCVMLGERGVLLRGASGAGKSSLADELIRRWTAAGRFGRLVADDRVLLRPSHGRLLARPHPALAGLIERRGHGIIATMVEPACVLRVVIDLQPDAPERLPAAGALSTEIEGVVLPCLRSGVDLLSLGRVDHFIANC